MAIVIPSKSTYQIQNPKVRDNVIERLEVKSKQVYATSQENETVYEGTYPYDEKNVEIESNSGQFKSNEKNGFTTVSYVGLYDRKTMKLRVEIPRVANNKYITLIHYYKRDEQPEIQLVLQGEKIVGDIYATYSYRRVMNALNPLELETKNIEYRYETNRTSQQYYIPTKVKHTYNGETEITAEMNFGDKTNIATATPTITEDKIVFDLELYVGYTLIQYGDTFAIAEGTMEGERTNIGGVYEKYVPKEIKLSFNGDTIGIDLNDKTVYINGQTAKKVHSVDGNELMQTDNYWLPTGESAIERSYGKTQEEYSNGKETATIRCSIADYYEADKDGFPTKNKVISIDKSTGRMLFKEYDIVIPMVYGADGKDRPMSKYKDGTPKQFRVLGVKPYYNGAVWQELYLQEIYQNA
jgi:hypothetical protein